MINGPRLEGRFPDGELGEIQLGSVTTLGRHPNSTIRLADNVVSKEHCVIESSKQGFIVRDLNSTNGTFVNGIRVRDHVRLRDGDELTLGKTKFICHLDEEKPGRTVTGNVAVRSVVYARPAIIAPIPLANSSDFRAADQITDLKILREDYEKLRIANEFHRAVGLERDLKAVLDTILQVAFELIPADNAAVFFADERGNLALHARIRRDAEDNSDLEVSDTVLNEVITRGDAVLTADAILDSRFSTSESVVSQGIRSAMAVPLKSKGILRGVLFCDTRVRTNAFSEKDLQVLAGIASQAAIAFENAELAEEIERSAIARAELARFLAPAVAAAVISGKVEIFRAGQNVEVTVMFADIRGFTSLAEREQPEEIVSMLNDFFAAMANLIFKYEGNLDKFIGDCVMATWGPPISHEDDAARTLRCALEMQEVIHEMNALREAQGKRAIEVGIGINTGPAVVGYFGSHERHEFTAIGDSVNIASRLCGLAQGGEILVTGETLERAGDAFASVPVDIIQVKGKARSISTHRVLGV